MSEEFCEWRLCTACKKETIHDEHDVKHGCVPFVCRECKTETIVMGYNNEEDILMSRDKEHSALRKARSNIPDNFNRKFGFRTTREERSRFSSLWVALVYECKTYEQRLDMLKADYEEHSFRNQRYKDLGVETDMQLVAMKFYKRFIKTMEKRRLRSLAVLDEFAKIKKDFGIGKED